MAEPLPKAGIWWYRVCACSLLFIERTARRKTGCAARVTNDVIEVALEELNEHR